MGGGASKQKVVGSGGESKRGGFGFSARAFSARGLSLRALSLKRANNFDAYLKFIQGKPFPEVTAAATKIQSTYRRTLAKRKLAKLKEEKIALQQSAEKYLENMKDAKKNLPGKLKMDGALSLIKDTLLTPVSVRSYGEIPYFSFPNRSIRGSSKHSAKTPRKSPRTARMSGPMSPQKSTRQGSHRVGFEDDRENEQEDDEEGSAKVLLKTVELFESTKPTLATSSRKPPSSKRSNKFTRYSVKASVKESGKSSKRTSVRNSTRSSLRVDDEDDFGRGRNMTSLIEEDESDNESFGMDTEGGHEENREGGFEKIYPMIGYVIKTRFQNSEKKVFINILHNASVNKIICSPFREYIDTSHYDDDGYVQSVSVAICDIIIPSNEFHKAFKFVEGKGLVSRTFASPMKSPRKGRGKKPKEIDMKAVLAEQCLSYLNSLSHCLDESNPPIAGLLDCDDYTIDESYIRLPKMKKMYYGTVPLYYYNKREQVLDFYQPLSWSYLMKLMPNSSNKNPMPETYFNHYFIDPFTSQVAENGDAPSAAMASFSVDDPKRRVFPPDLQYPMALSYQCLKGDFDPKNPMKANYSQLAGSTASSLRIGMLSDSAAGLESRSTDNAKVPSPNKKPAPRQLMNKQPFVHDVNLDDEDDDIPVHQKQFLEGLSKLKTGYPVYMDLSLGIMTLYLKRCGSSLAPGTSSLPQNGYNTININNNKNNDAKNGENIVHVPYGETFVARIALCNYVLNTSYDATNHIFYLHLETEFTPEHVQYNQFLISHYINDVSENIDLNKLTFQFTEYTEVMTMLVLIERHAFYCKHSATYSPSLLHTSSLGGVSILPSIKTNGGFSGLERRNNGGTTPHAVYSLSQIKYEQAPILAQPTSKFFALVERFSLFPLSRQKRYWKVDRGLVGVFEDDMKITPNWKNAIEIIALNNKRFEIVWHRKIVRLRKFMTKILLIDDKTKRIREFFFKGDGEIDQELQGIMSCVTQQIQYANATPFRYHYHYIEALGILNRPTNVTSDHLSVHGFDSQMQIIVPEPHTSDDDSDIEDPVAMTAIDAAADSTLQSELNPAPPPLQSILKTGGTGGGNGAAAHRMVSQRSTGNLMKNNSKIVYGSYFKVIRYKGKGKDRAPELTGPESANDDEDEDDDGKVKVPSTPEQIIDHWQQRLSEHYSDFSKLFFHCRLYFLEELDLLLFFQDFKLVSMMKLTKILEKPTVQSLNGNPNVNSNSAMAGGAPNGSNNLSLITGNILRRNSTPMKVINKPSTSGKETAVHSVTLDILPHIGTKVSSKGSQRAIVANMSAKLYNLDSDDSEEDDENSDRDYEENDHVNNYLINKSAKAQGSTRNGVTFSMNNSSVNQNDLTQSALIWIFKVLSDDGRTFRFKFHQKQAYDKLTKFYYQRCIKPVVKRDPTIFKENEILAAEPTLPEIVFDMDATKKHTRLLRPNEKVIGSGTVLKHEKTLPLMNAKDLAAVPKQRRVLLITDAPRMIFIDTIGGIVRGHVDFQYDSKNEVKVMEGNDFEITISGNLHRFTSAELPEKDPKYWVLRARQAMALAGSK